MKPRLVLALLLSGASISAALAGAAPASGQGSPNPVKGSVRADILESAGPRPDIAAVELDNPGNPRMPTLACRKGQSLDLSIGTPGWKLQMPDGSFSPIVPVSSASWPSLTGAAWHGPPGGGTGSFPVGYYTYSLQVMIEPCKAPNAVLDISYMADNQAVLMVGGTVVQQQAGTPYYGFLPGALTSYHQVLPATVSGTRTLIVRVENRSGPNKPYSTPTGVSARIILSR